MIRRNACLLVATAAAVLTTAVPAVAGNVGRHDSGPTFSSFGFTDFLDQPNAVTVEIPEQGYLNFTDTKKNMTTDATDCILVLGGKIVQCHPAASVTDVAAGVSLGAGADSAVVKPYPAGASLSAGISLSGGQGVDALESQGPATTFYGGAGDDTITPGPKADDISGDENVDTVTYAARTAAVTVDLGSDQSVMGQAGEKDRIRKVENVVGGTGADTLTGSADANVLFGGPGIDKLNAKGGQDTIEARDGTKDYIGCGDGSDEVFADYADVVSADCESVTRSGVKPGPGVVQAPGVIPPNDPPVADPKPGDPQADPDPGNPQNPAPGPTPGADKTAPQVSKVTFAPRTFRASATNTPTVTTSKKKATKKHRGSALSYRLTEAAILRIRIERLTSGRRSGSRCVKPTRKLRHRHAKRCTRSSKVVTLTRAGSIVGTNSVSFSGRIKRKALKAGSYRARITATDAAGNTSKTVSARFAIVR